MRKTGKVVRWDEGRGFGFIRSPNTDADVFFHVRDVKGVMPSVGLDVHYEEIHVGGKGPRAMAVESVALVAALSPRAGGRASGGQASSRAKTGRRPVDRWLKPVLWLALAWVGVLAWGAHAGRWPLWVVGAWLGVNVLAYLAYWQDKSAAQRGAWRTSEDTLHGLSLLGGWGGARLAQQVLRHKTSKASFQTAYWVSLVAHVGAVLGWLTWPHWGR
ncbi:MAG: hypothetical protein RI907_2538 [Pseudomonadota bacterium]|jgi:uncharacterized membrane protein YsdA (DUF1294 family)/cold shock CspA family protein